MNKIRLLGRAALAIGVVAWAAGAAGASYESTSLIDIPTNEYLDNLQYEFDLVAAASADPVVPGYAVLNTNLGLLGMVEAGLAVNSIWKETAISGHFKIEALDEEHIARWQPALSVGMDRISFGDGIVSHAGHRYPSDTATYGQDFADNVSPYVVASKTIDPVGSFHLGWGMGRFQGGGPNSRHFHGIFFGYNRRVWRTLEVMVEEDGRDVNFGVRATFPWVAVGTSIEAVEQVAGSFYPFYNVTLEFSPRLLHQAPERLALRRDINGVRDDVRDVAGRLHAGKDERTRIENDLARVQEEYRSRGIEPAALKRINDDITELQREIDAAKAASSPSEPAGTGL